VDSQIQHDDEFAQRLYRNVGAELCDDFLNVSLSGAAFLAVLSKAWPNPLAVTVRTGTNADADAVASLIRELAAFEGQESSYRQRALPLDDMAGCSHGSVGGACGNVQIRSRAQFLVAELPDEVPAAPVSEFDRLVGLVVFAQCYGLLCGRHLCVQVLVVREEARGQGVGSLLMQEVCRRGVVLGIRSVQWVALEESECARRFYETHLGACINATGRCVAVSMPVA